ncbi:hypothetical protein [Actinoplanes sp. DH11]|nr:hypothetical protein [Actinoplanes sp. DH11]
MIVDRVHEEALAGFDETRLEAFVEVLTALANPGAAAGPGPVRRPRGR